MYLLQVWFSLSDEGVEDAIYDSYAMRTFMGLDFALEQVPDATTLLHFRHLLETHELGKRLFESQNEIFDQQGWIMRGGSIVDATIIAAPSSTKNATGARDPEMRQTKKGNQWYFGMKAHIGVDAGTGYIHSVTATGANVHDLDEIVNLVRDDDEVVYTDAGYQGVHKRPDITGDEHRSKVEFRVAARKGHLVQMASPDRQAESRKASVRAGVEHPFLVLKRDFGFAKTRYRGAGQEPEPPARRVCFSELADAFPCRRPDGVTAGHVLPETGQNGPDRAGKKHDSAHRRAQKSPSIVSSCRRPTEPTIISNSLEQAVAR